MLLCCRRVAVASQWEQLRFGSDSSVTLNSGLCRSNYNEYKGRFGQLKRVITMIKRVTSGQLKPVLNYNNDHNGYFGPTAACPSMTSLASLVVVLICPSICLAITRYTLV